METKIAQGLLPIKKSTIEALSESCGLAVARALGSRSEDRGVDPCPMLDGSGVKAMPGLIPAPNPGSFNN